MALVVSIVDDDEFARDAMADFVRSLGFRAVTFDSAERFLDSPHASDTSCLITDLQMPGRNGLELQRHLIDADREIPIIFVTAYAEENARRQALSAGAVAFFSKPFHEASFVEGLQTSLKSKVTV